MITCYLRYEIDPLKVRQFETYGRMRGVSRSSRTQEAGCGGREGAQRGERADESIPCGRQRRVVLAPRCWGQVLGHEPRVTEAIKARSPGRARYKP